MTKYRRIEPIDAIQMTTIYRRKEGSANIYYWTSGIRIFPERLSICKIGFSTRTHARKGQQQRLVAQIMGSFKIYESSPLKQFYPFSLRSNIWYMNSIPLIVGYGTIGISNNLGRIKRENINGDFIVLQPTSYDWHEIKIHFFAGSIMDLKKIMRELKTGREE